MWVLDANNTKVHVLGGAYRNKEEIEGNYNFIGYACNAISDAWNEIALNNFNRELLAKGYANFLHTEERNPCREELYKVR